MKRLKLLVCGIAGLVMLGWVFAQETEPPRPVFDLPLVSPESAPEVGTFWLYSGSGEEGSLPPFPFDPYAGVIPIYSLPGSSGQYLIADTPTDYAQLQALQLELKSGGGMTMNSLEFPGEDGTNGTGGGEWEYTPIVHGSNDLWLELLSGSVTNGTAQILIHNPESLVTNNPIWDLYATTNLNLDFPGLNGTNWTWLLRTGPGQTNVTVPLLSEWQQYHRAGDTHDADGDLLTDLFELWVAHSNPATNDTDGDSLLDGWEWLHFGGFAQNDTGDFDSDGTNNLDEQTNETNPNDIAFTVRFPDEFVNQTNITGSCVVSAGVPCEMAVLINSTNFAAATWLPYTASFPVNLGPTDAVYIVRVALRGRAPEFPPVRDEAQLILDRVAPTLAVTNPIGSTVIKPYLQLQGWANEPLRSLSYNLSNAFELITNVPASVVDEAFDTNSFDFTTNWFQAYDVPLATNLNHILLSVADRAGNVTSTNLLITLDYSGATNSPVTQLQWPTNGLTIAGTNMTLRGQINDETASVSVYWVSGGETNYWPGVVERNGQFWIEQLPLNVGTNQLTLRAVDAAGNVSESGFNVVRGSLTVNLGTTPDLYEPSGTVSGTVSDPDASVSVNGVAATVDEYGQWSADDVPLYGAGVSVFDLTATPPSGPAEHITYTLEKPARIRVVKHFMKQGVSSVNWDRSWIKSYRAWDETGANGLLQHKYQGTASDYENFHWYPAVLTDYAWSDSNPVGTYQVNGGQYGGPMNENHWLVKSVPDQQVDHEESDVHGTTRYMVEHFYARGVRHEWPGTGGGTAVETLEARTKLRLYTGGKAEVGKQSLHSVQAQVEEYGTPLNMEWGYTPREMVANERLSINGERVDAEGKIWRVLAANSTMDVNIKSDGSQHDKTTYDKTKHELVIKANGIDLSVNTPTFCVGQYISFSQEFDQSLPPGTLTNQIRWSFEGTWFNAESNAVPGLAFPECSMVAYQNSALLTNAEARSNWWVSGGFNPPEIYTVNLRELLTFPNGKLVTAKSAGEIYMVRPRANINAFTTHPTNISSYVVFGALVSNAIAPGIVFSNTVEFSANYPGDVQWVQVWKSGNRYITTATNSSYGSVVVHYNTNNSPGPFLDTAYPYPSESITNGVPQDAPSFLFYAQEWSFPIHMSVFETYEMTMMYKPTGGKWVPLRAVDWFWGYGITKNWPYPTNVSEGWQFVGSTNSVNPPDHDLESYPFWRSTWNQENSIWVPPIE